MVSPIFDDTWMTPNEIASDAHATEGARVRTRCGSARVSARRPRITRNAAEGAVLLLVVALLLVYVGTVIGERFMRPQQVPVVTVKVQPGDTLWSLADRYGSPNEYILRRVDRLAKYNDLSAGARLQPGQVLQVPVENPAEQQRILVSVGSAR